MLGLETERPVMGFPTLSSLYLISSLALASGSWLVAVSWHWRVGPHSAGQDGGPRSGLMQYLRVQEGRERQ